MVWRRLMKPVLSAGLALIFSLGTVAVLQTTANAQNWRRASYDRREDERRGYRDGEDRGREDARDRRSFNPNNSEHYRRGNGAYREGFRRGYSQGYRSFAGRRRW